MNAFRLTVSTPDGDRFSGEATMLSLRGSEGDLAILAGHIPFITAVKPGEVAIDLPDGSARIARTESGLLTVGQEQVTLLSDSFAWDE